MNWMPDNQPSGTATRSLLGVAVALVVPALLAMQSGVPPVQGDEMWKSIAMVALGGLVTAFVLGRNAVTRDDLTALEVKLVALIKEETPREAVVQRRLEDGQKKIEDIEGRLAVVATDAQTASFLKDFVLQAREESMGLQGRLSKLEAHAEA